MEIQTVLCPIDFSSLSPREVDLAVEVCQAFGARLVLLHNLVGVSADWSKVWEWQRELPPGQEGSEPDAETRMQQVIDRMPAGVRAEAMITRGPIGLVLLRLAEDLPADLVVLGCHGYGDEDHSSVTERVLERCPCPILTLHEGKGAEHPFRLRTTGDAQSIPVVVPTDFSASADQAVSYAFALAEKLPLELHLLHVISRPPAPAAVPIDPMEPLVEHPEQDVEIAMGRLRTLIPEALASRTECHVKVGDPAATIADFAHRIDPDFLVMGEHARGFFRRLLTRDTSRELLHRAECPVWYVPAAATATQARA